jgi:hypothetical protein
MVCQEQLLRYTFSTLNISSRSALRKLSSLAVVAVLVGLSACARRAASPGVPAVPVTPAEQFAVTNAQLATLNHAVEQGVAQLNAAGVIPNETAQAVLTWNFKVADSDKQITLIAQSSSAPDLKGQQIQAIIAQLKASATRLVTDGSLNVKNPVSQQTIVTDIQAMLSLADEIVKELEASGTIHL